MHISRQYNSSVVNYDLVYEVLLRLCTGGLFVHGIFCMCMGPELNLDLLSHDSILLTTGPASSLSVIS